MSLCGNEGDFRLGAEEPRRAGLHSTATCTTTWVLNCRSPLHHHSPKVPAVTSVEGTSWLSCPCSTVLYPITSSHCTLSKGPARLHSSVSFLRATHLCAHFLSKVLEDAFYRDMGVYPGRSRYHTQEHNRWKEFPGGGTGRTNRKGYIPRAAQNS